MKYVIDPPAQVSLPVRGSDASFPVHRIYCVGRNYAAHAVEMGHDPDKEPPFFFQKNPDNLLLQGRDFPYPAQTGDVHHEIEMTVALKAGGTDIPVAEALDCVFGYGVSLDMTRRDLQQQARQKSHPWEFAKAFSGSAPVGALVRAAQLGKIHQASITLNVNGTVRQSSNVSSMIWNVGECIAALSRFEALQAGDLLMTGTPEGVGAVVRGDVMQARIDGLPPMRVEVA